MSYDLIFWRGRPTDAPWKVWKQLYAKRPVPFVMPLVREEVLAGFRREYGVDLRLLDNDVQGRGWEFALDDGDRYLHVTCAWALAEDEPALARLRRAGRYAGCSVFDPQTGVYREESAQLAEPTRPAAPEPTHAEAPTLQPGDPVTHATFGAGEVLTVESSGPSTKVRVRFADAERTLLARVLRGRLMGE